MIALSGSGTASQPQLTISPASVTVWQRVGGKHRIANGHPDESGERRFDCDSSGSFGHGIQHERREHADDD